MVASMEFDMALYNAIKEAALSRIEAISGDDFIINRAWAKDITARLG
jgi:ribosomal protein S12 methylthiotransferase accessory factor YcaO